MIPFPILSNTNVLESVKIVKVAAGAQHFAFLTDTGDVYTVGTNAYGQCGTGNTSPVTTPVKVLSEVKDIFCGDRITFAVMKADGSILVSGARNAIGINASVSTFANLGGINGQQARGVVKICASERACAVMYEDKTMWTCGVGFLGAGYVSSMRNHLEQVATDCIDMSVTVDSMYYRDSNQNIWGVGEFWALNLPTTGQNQATWAVQYGGLYTPVFKPELKTHYRCCIFPDTSSTYCVGIAMYGQLGNGVITDVQGNRVYPRNTYLSGVALQYGSSRGMTYNSMVVKADGIYFTGQTLNNNSGFPSIGTNVGTYRTIPTTWLPAGQTFDGNLVTSLETNTNCTYMIYNGQLYCAGLMYDGVTNVGFKPFTIRS